MALASVDKLLTIAIPTYNRPAKIKNTVSLLLPQLHSNVKVLILDNCSPVNVANYLKEQIGHNVLDEVEVIRHKTNIGGDANFQRCFELCNTPYIWMLGDDDKIENNALEIILKEIAAYRDHDIVGINFSSNILHNVERHTAVLINNTEEFTQKLDHFGNLLFISATVYKTQEYLKYLHLAAWGAYGMASQLIPAMVAISYNKVLVLSEKYIVTNLAVDDPNEKWSDVQITLSLSSLLEAPIGLKNDEYLLLGRKFNVQQYVSFSFAIYSILKTLNFNIQLIDSYHIYIYKQIFHRTFVFREQKIKTFLIYIAGLVLLNNKWLFKIIVGLNKNWFKKKVQKVYKTKLFFRKA